MHTTVKTTVWATASRWLTGDNVIITHVSLENHCTLAVEALQRFLQLWRTSEGREHILNQLVLIHQRATLSSKKHVANTAQALWWVLALKTKLLRLCWGNSTCLNSTLALQQCPKRVVDLDMRGKSKALDHSKSLGLKLDRLVRGGGCCSSFSSVEQNQREMSERKQDKLPSCLHA